MRLRTPLGMLALLLAAGCAGSAASTEAPPRRSQYEITAEEVRGAGLANAYDLVQSLRPAWLRTRGSQSFNDPGVIMIYYDLVRLGGPESLRSIPMSGVETMQFLDAASATQRWGTGHNHGAILVRAPIGRR